MNFDFGAKYLNPDLGPDPHFEAGTSLLASALCLQFHPFE
jgi:hypothetical protein